MDPSALMESVQKDLQRQHARIDRDGWWLPRPVLPPLPSWLCAAHEAWTLLRSRGVRLLTTSSARGASLSE